MSLQSQSDGDNSPPMGEVNQPSKEDILHKLRLKQEQDHFDRLWWESRYWGRQFICHEKLVDLDNLSDLDVSIANRACNRTAPVFLVLDFKSWQWLDSATFCGELLLYTQKRWFRPYESHIDRGQFLTKLCVVPRSPAPPTGTCSQEMVDYIKMWTSRTSSFNVEVTDISTIPVQIIRTGVEDDLSAPVDLEQVPECDRQAVTADPQWHLSAVQVTLDVAITFLMALEKREEADGPVTRDVMQSTRAMTPSTDYAARYMDKFGWDQNHMGPLMGPSSAWVDATKGPRLSVEEHETFKHYQSICDSIREEVKTEYDPRLGVAWP